MSRWRVGSKVAINVYECDRPVCQCHNPEDAARIVAAMNRWPISVSAQEHHVLEIEARLDMRFCNVLIHHGLETAEKIALYGKTNLERLKNLGPVGRRQIADALAGLGLSLEP